MLTTIGRMGIIASQNVTSVRSACVLAVITCLVVLLGERFSFTSFTTTVTLKNDRGPVGVLEIQEDKEEVSKDSFFNCDEENAICNFFRPHHFFHSGLGAPFLPDYKRLGGTNQNLPACTGLSWWPLDKNLTSHYNYVPQNISFVHMHKCGGTTVKAAMQDLRRAIRSEPNFQSRIESYRYSFGGGSAKQKERNSKLRLDHIQSIAEAQERQLLFPVFTLVRDPVDRFLSGVQQVMHYNDDFRSKCLKKTAKMTIQCAIEDVTRTSFRRDVHLVPMAMHLRLFDEYDDLKVAVFHLKDIKHVLRYLGATGEAATHTHDRTQEKYATSKVLATMTANDCDEHMLRDICGIYAVDVAMMRSMGYAPTSCPT